MNWKNRIILILVVLSAGWMLFDGTRALLTGDYITPKTGDYAGQLGPWANLAKAVGVEPRSTLMKMVFVVYGIAALLAVAGFASNRPWSRNALIAMAILGLWYLPFGTVANIIVLILLFVNRS